MVLVVLRIYKHVFLIFVSSLWSHQSEIIFFNFWIRPGFILEPFS